MPITRTRAEASEGAPSAKKQKVSHQDSNFASNFATGLLNEANVERLNSSYKCSEPYLHAVVDKLFQEDLLSKVKDECINELSFTEKETDIYKVRLLLLLQFSHKDPPPDVCKIKLDTLLELGMAADKYGMYLVFEICRKTITCVRT